MRVLITGASGGLGRAFALECARRGYDLVLTDLEPDALRRAARGIGRQYDVAIEARPCDLTDAAAAEALFAGIGELDMLLNIAGLDHEGGFARRGFDDIRGILRLNIEATLRVTHAALGCRRAGERFAIVFVSSLASICPMPLKATYAASKRFLLDFAIALGQELEGEGVSALALCPGGMPTREDCVQAIEAQGFWGWATSTALEKVARRTIDRALAGHRVYVPGALNCAFGILARVLPPTAVAKLLHQRWRARSLAFRSP